MSDAATQPCPACNGTGAVRTQAKVIRSAPTDRQLFEDMLTYLETRHLPGCPCTDVEYCVDCHAGVFNVREMLRERGADSWPDDLVDRAIKAMASK